MQRRRRLRKGVSNFSSVLRKELREGNLQSLLGGSSFVVPSSHAEPDPLVSSFIYNPPAVVEPPSVQSLAKNQATLVAGSSIDDSVERYS